MSMEESKLINNELKVISCTLSQLLNSANVALPNSKIYGQLTIPEYQRPYVWQEKQINRLIDDLLEYDLKKENDSPLYYLGSIILHKDGDSLKIIDGQQRITTALLIQKIKDSTKKSGIKYSSTTSIKKIEDNLSYLKSIRDRKIFEYREHNVFSKINLDNINITLVITTTEDLAYTFFETQNTGGIRLSGSDVLKAHHLRAISNRKTVNYQARKWESKESKNVEKIIQQLTKIRFWDKRKWRKYPFYRDIRGIKEVIIDEYTQNTGNNNDDVSYHYSAVKNDNGRLLQMHESSFKMLKQPLSNGNNTLDYINDYVELYNILFKQDCDRRVDDDFYVFRNKLLHGKDGTVFLKELFEVSIISYVSRFGYHRLFEASLWLYRSIYTLRVTSSRNVREDSAFKFVYDNQFIDNILEVFTPDELFLFLKKFTYKFNVDNLDTSKAKGKHISSLNGYFGEKFDAENIKKAPDTFDDILFKIITEKITKK